MSSLRSDSGESSAIVPFFCFNVLIVNSCCLDFKSKKNENLDRCDKPGRGKSRRNDFALVFLLGTPDFFPGFSRLWVYYPAILFLAAGPAANFATLGVVEKLLGEKST